MSVGEVNLLAKTIDAFRARQPDWDVVLSTTTKTGYELAKRKYVGHCVFYCPLDFSWAVRRAMARIRPDLFVLAELELWPNLIAAARSHGAQIAIINGRLSDNSFRGYRRVRPLIAHVLQQIDLIAAQDEETAERFRALGARAESVHTTGSLKYDGAETDCNNPRTRELKRLAKIEADDIVLLAGSTQAPEEQMALAIFRRLKADHPRLRLIVVPRHPERFDEVARLLDASGLDWNRRSRMDESPIPPSSILLADTVGELGAWWGAAHIAFVGGSFGSRGGQNMLEPAAYGAAVSFGPNTKNFRDIVAALLSRDAAVVVKSEAELEAFVRRCLEDLAFAKQLGDHAQALVQSQLGATEKTINLLVELPFAA